LDLNSYVADPDSYLTSAFPVLTGQVVSGDGGLDIDGPVNTLRGAVTYDGATPPSDGAGGYDDYTITFISEDGYSYSTSGNAGTYQIDVPDGTYTVTLDLNSYVADPDSYLTSAFPVLTGQVVSGDGGLDIDGPVNTLRGAVTYDGATPPSDGAGGYDDYAITFISEDGYSYSTAGNAGTYQIDVPDGVYTVTLDLNSYVADPDSYLTSAFPVLTGEVVAADGGLDIAADIYEVFGAVTYDGATPPSDGAGGYDDYSITFVSDDGYSYSTAGNAGIYRIDVPAGVYGLTLDLNSYVADPYTYLTSAFPVAECIEVGP
jgi:uncharacterized iron-regulated membrane protein